MLSQVLMQEVCSWLPIKLRYYYSINIQYTQFHSLHNYCWLIYYVYFPHSDQTKVYLINQNYNFIKEMFKIVALFFTLCKLCLSQYIAATFTPASYVINQLTQYTIIIYRNNNPITSEFIFPVKQVSSAAYLQIKMPTSFPQISNQTNPPCQNSQTGANLLCSANSQTNIITVFGLFNDSSSQIAQVLTITIKNIKNPPRTESSGNFQYYIRNSNSNIIDQSPSATSGLYSTSITYIADNFLSCSITASNNYISTRSKLNFKFKIKNPIPSDGRIIIDFPLTWDSDLQQSYTIASTPTCTPISGISSTTCSYSIFTSPINIARITISSLSTSGLLSNSQFSIDISSILTPPYINYPTQIPISSEWSDGVKIDRCTSNVADLAPIPFKSTIFTVQSGSTTVQSKFSAKLDVTLSKYFSYQDQISLNLPNNFFSNNQISLTSSTFLIFTTTVEVLANNVGYTRVTLSNFPASPSVLPSNNILTLIFSNITNFQSVQPQRIQVFFYRQSELYQSSTTSYFSTVGTFSNFTIKGDDSTVVNFEGKATIILQSQFQISAGSIIEITYNSAINANNLNETLVSAASLNGIRITNVSYRVTENTITITNLFQTLFSGGSIQVQIPKFVNPPTVMPLPYSLLTKSSTNYGIASAIFTFSATSQVFKSGSARLTASSYTVLAPGVTYSLQFQTYYGFRSVSIIIPPQITISNGFQSTCSPNSFTSCTITQANGQGFRNLTFLGTMQGGIQRLNWGGVTNPNSFKPTSSFQLFTYLNGWEVEKSSGNIVIVMNSQATTLSSQVVPSSKVNQALINLQISFTIPAMSPNGTITISAPNDIDILGSTCSIISQSCSINYQSVTINFLNTNQNSTHSFTLTLTRVKNAPSLKTIGIFNFTLITTDFYQSISSIIESWTNINLSGFISTVSSLLGYRGERTTFSFNITGLSGKQRFINVRINSNFAPLSANFTPISSTIIDQYQLRFTIPGQGSTQFSISLQTPIIVSQYTFYLKTFSSDQYAMGESTTNIWRHACYGTECRSCNGTLCLTCYNSTLTQLYKLNTVEQTCIRACPTSFYLESISNNCIKCSSNCLQCTNSSNTCTKCPIAPVVNYLNTEFSTCVSQCSLTYYPNSFTQKCAPCISPCYRCSSDLICITCVTGYFYLQTSSSCLTDCPADKMVKNYVNKTCDFCSINCLTCSIFTYNCTSCNNTQGLYLQIDKCVTNCSSQRFLKNNICTLCQSPCRVCLNSTTTCSSCFPNSNLSLWYNYKCISVSECTIGYFVNSVNGSCDICPSSCQKCISILNCTNCVTGFYLYGNACIAKCPNITFQNSNTLTCDSCIGCVTCTSSTNCTSCRTTQSLYLSTCYSICPSGTYQDSETVNGVRRSICTVCPSHCPTCFNSTYCLTCLSEKYLYKGVCYTTCPISTFPQYPKCTDCPATCLTCSSLTNCLTCRTNYSLQNSECVLNCKLGISYNQVCYPCGLNCRLCINTTCSQCSLSYYLFQNVCMSLCPSSTLTLDNLTCVSCTSKYVNCSTCNQTDCLSCIDGQLKNGICQPCIPGFYSHNSRCVSCPTACTICQSPTQCSSCSNGYYFESNFCVATCPSNKFPNGTKCDFCIQYCSICNLATTLCSICTAGMYQFQGNCLSSCPDPYVINLNYTLCVTQEQYSQQYSKASKPIYFPFTIAIVIVVIIGIILNCYIKTMHIFTFLVSIICWVQLASWILFGTIQYLFYNNLQKNAIIGAILVLIGVITQNICNFVFLRLYYKYFSDDVDFIKWEKRHSCINKVFLILATIFSFKFHRLIYSKTLDRDELSMVLSSIRKIVPVSVLSIVSILVSSAPIIVGSSLAIYNSIGQDQQFFNALDTLTVTGIMILLLLLDLRHKNNYFVDEFEAQHIRNKIYHEDFEEFSINKKVDQDKLDFQKGSNLSRENLLDAVDSGNPLDNMTTAKKFRVNKKSQKFPHTDEMGETQRENNNNRGENLNVEQQYDQEDVLQQPSEQIDPNKKLWVEKQYDHHGYLIKYDKNNNLLRFDKNGYRVEIDQKGQHHKFNQQGYQMKLNKQTNQFVRYDSQGLMVGQNQTRYDSRGYRVQKQITSQGMTRLKFYDQNGYQVIKDEITGEQTKINNRGNKIVIDPIAKIHRQYNKEGFEIIRGSKEGQQKYKNKNGNFVRFNKKLQHWQEYDPQDNLLLRKNIETGEYQKFDEHGFRVEKDQYGNVYRYDNDGYRVILNLDGHVRRFDEQGYEVKRDPVTGKQNKYDKYGYRVQINPQTKKKTFYDSNGYRVERDFYGKATLYDEEGNTVLIDKQTKKHRKFNKDGLQIVDDEKKGRYLIDRRGRRVVDLQNGNYEKYDQSDNKIYLDPQGYEVETDENGNITRFDKFGDPVQQSEQSNQIEEGWAINEDKGDQGIMQGKKQQVSLKQQQKKRRKFKIKEELNYQQQYNKLLKEEKKPLILFDFEEEQQQENLREFHDFEPVEHRQLQKQYEALYNMEAEKQFMHRENSLNKINLDLNELQDPDEITYKYLNQRGRKRNQTQVSKNQRSNNGDELEIDPENKQEKHEIRSVADVSVNERSFVNEGVRPLTTQRSRNSQQDIESIDEIDPKLITNKQKIKKNKGDGTQSENNFVKNTSRSIKSKHTIVKEETGKKIFDSDQQIQSLGEQDWQNEAIDIFYKDNHNSNQNTNTNEKGLNLQDQSDILSDYIPQQTIDNQQNHKGSEENIFHKKYMQSIQEVEDQLFDKLKSQDNRIKRSHFRLSGNPNPLVQYAKTIQQKKNNQVLTKKNRRYPDLKQKK